MHKNWRLNGISGTYQVARRHDVPGSGQATISPHLVSLYIDQWLADPFSRQKMVEMYESVSGQTGPGAARLRGPDLHRFIKPKLLEAFRRGEFVLVRVAHKTTIPVKEKEKEEAPAEEAKQPSPANEEEVYVIAHEVRTIGDTPLVNHRVRILDPDTGRQIGNTLTTGDDGVVRAIVPENKDYRIEILDEENESSVPSLQPYEEPTYLICRFVDESGSPVANTKVEAREDDYGFELTTDEDGRIDCCADLGSFELKINDQVFHAHSVLLKDREKEENHYRFVVSATAGQDDQASDPVGRLPHYDAPANQGIDA